MKDRIIIVFFLIVGLTFFGFSSKERDTEFMKTELIKIEEYIQFRDSLDIEVSAVNVAWHLDHTLKVVNGIYDSLVASNPAHYRSQFNFSRVMSFTFGKIPRGRASSPSYVLPPDTITTTALYQQLQIANMDMKSIDELDQRAHFRHPVFGVLNRKRSKRFIEIHTRHHLAIIEDILSKN